MSDVLLRRTGDFSGAGREEAIISRRSSESRVFCGENLWAEVRRTAPEEDTGVSADCPAIGKTRINMSMNSGKAADFRMD
jgi:hypothetical protein